MGIGSLFLGALLVMVLWNAVVPDLFELPRLGYWQAFAVLFLSRILFGGLHACDHSGHSGGRWRDDIAAKMKEKFETKTKGMSDAEKQKFKDDFTSGKWDVNVIEVEEEESEQKKDEEDLDSDDSKGSSGASS